MSRYFFDIDDGQRAMLDETGHVYATRMAARDAAIGVLPNIARDELPDGDDHTFIVKIRDAAGRYIFKASLSLRARWLDVESGREEGA